MTNETKPHRSLSPEEIAVTELIRCNDCGRRFRDTFTLTSVEAEE